MNNTMTYRGYLGSVEFSGRGRTFLWQGAGHPRADLL